MIEDNLALLLLAVATTGAIQYGLVRRQVANIADPLIYLISTFAFSFALGCFAVDDSWLLARIFLYFACFYAGFLVISRPSRRSLPPLQVRRNLRCFRAVVVVCGLVYLGLNAVMWIKSGAVLFSGVPSTEKSEAYASGYGYIRRFNWSVGVFALIASLYWWIFERTAIALLFVVLSMLITIVGGGKGALLPALFAGGLFISKPFVTASSNVAPSCFHRVLLILIGLALIPVAAVLIVENGSIEGALDAFVIRLFYYGDVLLYWGRAAVRIEFSGLGPLDFLYDTFGSILGALRLIDYRIPIGNQFVRSTLPFGAVLSESVGPNLPFYVRGELYFGPFFAPLHAFVIGVIMGRLRRMFLSYCGHSLMMYSLLSFAVILSVTLPADEGLAIRRAFDFIIYFVPIYVTVSCIVLAAKPVRCPTTFEVSRL